MKLPWRQCDLGCRKLKRCFHTLGSSGWLDLTGGPGTGAWLGGILSLPVDAAPSTRRSQRDTVKSFSEKNRNFRARRRRLLLSGSDTTTQQSLAASTHVGRQNNCGYV